MGNFFSVRFCADHSNADDFFFPALILNLALPENDQLHSVLASSKFKIPAYKRHCELYSVHSPCSQEHMNQI